MHSAVTSLVSSNSQEQAYDGQEYTPAVSVRKSLASREHIISLIDGKPYKTLKRHLAGHGLTPAEYRERYGLKADYPMVAPNYAGHRRALAKKIGLGRKPGRKMTVKPAATESSPAKAAAAKPAQPKAKAATKPARRKKAAAPANGAAAPRNPRVERRTRLRPSCCRSACPLMPLIIRQWLSQYPGALKAAVLHPKRPASTRESVKRCETNGQLQNLSTRGAIIFVLALRLIILALILLTAVVVEHLVLSVVLLVAADLMLLIEVAEYINARQTIR